MHSKSSPRVLAHASVSPSRDRTGTSTRDASGTQMGSIARRMRASTSPGSNAFATAGEAFTSHHQSTTREGRRRRRSRSRAAGRHSNRHPVSAASGAPPAAFERQSCAPATREPMHGHQRPSTGSSKVVWRMVIRGHQRPSEAIRGHQRSSEVIRGHQRSSTGVWRMVPRAPAVVCGRTGRSRLARQRAVEAHGSARRPATRRRVRCSARTVVRSKGQRRRWVSAMQSGSSNVPEVVCQVVNFVGHSRHSSDTLLVEPDVVVRI